MRWYFDQFEGRRPPDPIRTSIPREFLWQVLATANVAVGFWYLHWRWTASINWDATWFSIPLVVAETLAVFGVALFAFNLWSVRDTRRAPPPEDIRDCLREPDAHPSRPVKVDLFFPTFDEDPELVRLSIRDAKATTYEKPIDKQIYVLDDGARPEMRRVAEEEGVRYITRQGNVGFKAGNLRNAMEQTSGDFIVICDADTRPFPTILEHTLGYFRDPDVAWVQTPQWFFDIPEGRTLPVFLGEHLGSVGRAAGRLIEALFGEVRVGADPFVNDPQMFYDVIQRRRNGANASFCCGAGSIHRREAVLEAALRTYGKQVGDIVDAVTSRVLDDEIRADLEDGMTHQVVQNVEFTPYKFHVSEDIYTSIALHADPMRNWKSVFHPLIESKMLSPQDLETWTVQRFKYAAGSLDIVLHDNPLGRRGLSFAQRMMYGATFFSYLACTWNIIFLISPIVFLFTGIPPVSAYSPEFFIHFVPFVLLNELAFMIGTWGISGWDGKASYMSFFPVNFKALWTVLRGREIKFPTTPKERKTGRFGRLVIPQMCVVGLTLLGIGYCVLRLALGMPVDTSAFLSNTFWGLSNVSMMMGIILAAYWQPPSESAAGTGVEL